jgi:hypothetical protein
LPNRIAPPSYLKVNRNRKESPQVNIVGSI